MIILALDTSTPHGAVALLRDGKPLAEETFHRAAGAAAPGQNLFASIQTILGGNQITPGDVGLYAVGVGPGSFTGIRGGIAAAKGLALPHARPIKAVSSFDALAMTVAPKTPPDCQQICILCDARRDEIYFAIYDRDGRRTRDCQIGVLEQIADEIHNPLWFISPEIEKFQTDLTAIFGGFAKVSPTPLFPSAAALGWLAARKFLADGNRGDESIEPIYLRETDYKKL